MIDVTKAVICLGNHPPIPPFDSKLSGANRILQLCDERRIAVNELASISGISPSTVYSILNEKSQNPGTITIKKLCDGLEITLGEFFSTPEFDALEQEIK